MSPFHRETYESLTEPRAIHAVIQTIDGIYIRPIEWITKRAAHTIALQLLRDIDIKFALANPTAIFAYKS